MFTNEARLRRIERKLDLILEHLGVEDEITASLSDAVLDALRRGRKIEAIKHYREETGCGLREAKEVIDSVS